jgi:hypothetical protein
MLINSMNCLRNHKKQITDLAMIYYGQGESSSGSESPMNSLIARNNARIMIILIDENSENENTVDDAR